MLDKLLNQDINAEIIAALIFAVASGLYLFLIKGPTIMIDNLFAWMFPASVMIFLTLVLVKIIELWHGRVAGRYRYVDWRKKV
ncbi:MAG: hypothetical protein ABSG05_00505 [Candidatus Pacearchaeota archaeon]|jgi:hypothetical protein